MKVLVVVIALAAVQHAPVPPVQITGVTTSSQNRIVMAIRNTGEKNITAVVLEPGCDIAGGVRESVSKEYLPRWPAATSTDVGGFLGPGQTDTIEGSQKPAGCEYRVSAAVFDDSTAIGSAEAIALVRDARARLAPRYRFWRDVVERAVSAGDQKRAAAVLRGAVDAEHDAPASERRGDTEARNVASIGARLDAGDRDAMAILLNWLGWLREVEHLVTADIAVADEVK